MQYSTETEKLLKEVEVADQEFQANLVPSLLAEISTQRKLLAIEKQQHSLTRKNLERIYEDLLVSNKVAKILERQIAIWRNLAVSVTVLLAIFLTIGAM